LYSLLLLFLFLFTFYLMVEPQTEQLLKTQVSSLSVLFLYNLNLATVNVSYCAMLFSPLFDVQCVLEQAAKSTPSFFYSA